MLNFPVPYGEELIYSTVARAGVREGLISPKQLLDEVFGDRCIVATLDLPNHISAIARWLPKKFEPERLVYEHTLFPIYAPFVPEGRRQRCIQWMLGASKGAVHLTLGVAASVIKTPRFIRYCPGCLRAQAAQHGEYFWLREWQVAGLEACPTHGALADTRMPRPAFERHRFVAASPECCPLAPQAAGQPVSAWISSQLRQLLEGPAQPSPSFAQWTAYYKALATQYGFSRGKAQIDHQALQDTVLRVWPTVWLLRHHLAPDASGAKGSWWLEDIFRRHRRSFSYLQHIIVHRALLGERWQIREVLDEVRRYPAEVRRPQVPAHETNGRGLEIDQEKWLRLLSDRSPKQARITSPALYARLYRNHRDWLLEVNSRHTRHRADHDALRVDWSRRDREHLRVLRRLIARPEARKEGPRRSRAYYLKILGDSSTIGKNLHRLPLLAQFLCTHAETVAQYQVRRLKMAYECLQNEYGSPARWRLLRNARLSEERLTEPARRYLDNRVHTKHAIQRRSK